MVASAAFRAAEVAGRLGDTLRGANVAEILVPTAEERASPLGVLYLLLATIVFLQIGGVARLVEALMSSYQTLPIGGGLEPLATRRAALVVVAASAKLIASGLALAAPVVVALWLTDLALGLVARAAPSVPVYFLGLPLKGLLAIGVVLAGSGDVAGGAGGRFCRVVEAVCASGSRFRGLTLGSSPPCVRDSADGVLARGHLRRRLRRYRRQQRAVSGDHSVHGPEGGVRIQAAPAPLDPPVLLPRHRRRRFRWCRPPTPPSRRILRSC